jgi:uncharacterized protein (TIGR02611 family)
VDRAREDQDLPPLARRLRNQRERHVRRPRVLRVLYVLVGFTVLLAGLAMLVTPGPAFVVIPIGLSLLALEFDWAEKALERSLLEAAKAKRRAQETTTTQRVLSGIATALACAAIVAWAIWGDIPVFPV